MNRKRRRRGAGQDAGRPQTPACGVQGHGLQGRCDQDQREADLQIPLARHRGQGDLMDPAALRQKLTDLIATWENEVVELKQTGKAYFPR